MMGEYLGGNSAVGFLDRSVTDIILIIITATVGASLIVITVAIIVFAITEPDFDIEQAITALGNLLTLMVGAVVGYLAGKRERT